MRLVSKVDLARALGVSRPAITKRCQGSWADACVGDRVDIDHPLIREHAERKGVKLAPTDRAPTEVAKETVTAPAEPTASAKTAPAETAKPTRHRPEAELPPQPANAGTPQDLEQIEEFLRPFTERFGTPRAYRDIVTGRKDSVITRRREFDLAKARGEVWPRDFVKTYLIGIIEGFNHRLLSDAPKTICREIYALAKTGRPLEEAEKITRKLLGQQLLGVKERLEKSILNGDNPSDAGGSGKPGEGDLGSDNRADSDEPLRMGRE